LTKRLRFHAEYEGFQTGIKHYIWQSNRITGTCMNN
jgi:hypothetical protein